MSGTPDTNYNLSWFRDTCGGIIEATHGIREVPSTERCVCVVRRANTRVPPTLLPATPVGCLFAADETESTHSGGLLEGRVKSTCLWYCENSSCGVHTTRISSEVSAPPGPVLDVKQHAASFFCRLPRYLTTTMPLVGEVTPVWSGSRFTPVSKAHDCYPLAENSVKNKENQPWPGERPRLTLSKGWG